MIDRVRIFGAIAVFVAVSGFVLPSDARAHEGATGVVKQRMELMKKLGSSMKTISAMVGGKIPHETATFRQAALRIADHGGATLTALFPKGSVHGPSEATPGIWQDWNRFSAYAEEVRLHARALAEAADNPPEAVYRRLGKTCGGCHRDFRKKKK